MKLKLRDILLMVLRASDNSVSGKTKIQKECYLLSVRMGEDFGFQAHYYGPYSQAVDYSLSELVGIGFVEEKRIPWGLSNRGFEVVRYDYKLTNEGKHMANLLKRGHTERYTEIYDLVETLKQLGDPDYMQLSMASKAYFILKREGKEMTPEEIRQKAKQFNWNLTTRDVGKAVQVLEQLELIEKPN